MTKYFKTSVSKNRKNLKFCKKSKVTHRAIIIALTRCMDICISSKCRYNNNKQIIYFF